MGERNSGEVPARLRRLEQRFSAWRKTRVRGERIPDSLWKSAAKLAADYGLSLTSTVLKLDYYSLKKHVDFRLGEIESPSLLSGGQTWFSVLSRQRQLSVSVKGP